MPTQLKSKCPKCGAVFRADETLVGKRVRCPKCQGQFELTQVQFSPSSPSLAQAPQANETIAPASSDTSRSPDLFPPGENIGKSSKLGHLGRFELQELLGQGAFGRVYRAYDPQLDREVALKVPLFGPEDQHKIDRFITEAKSAARLHHANIVPIHDIGQAAGRHYIVARFVRGQTLSKRIEEKPPDFRQAAEWVRQLAEALAYAHGQGIVHRDIKPANIMLDEQDVPQIMDFGLAKRVNESSGMTIDGTLLGTPDYMSPEQARGDLANVGPRSDQYSLGVVLYELLTEKRPFEGSAPSVVAQVLTAEPLPPRSLRGDIPAELASICQRAMHKQPANRYASAAEMGKELSRWLESELIRNQPLDAVIDFPDRSPLPATPSPLPKPVRLAGRQLLVALGFVLGLGGVVLSGLLVTFGQFGSAGVVLCAALVGLLSLLLTIVRKWRWRAIAPHLTRMPRPQSRRLVIALGAVSCLSCLGLYISNFTRTPTNGHSVVEREPDPPAESGQGSDVDPPIAVSLDKAAIEALYKQGEKLYYGMDGIQVNHSEAAKRFLQAAENGHVLAQYTLGAMHVKGSGVAKDDVEAAIWYRRAAEQGNVSAQYNLAVMYASGRGVSKDEVHALDWYRQAAEQGNAPAQFNVAYMYNKGTGVARDDVEAVKWYRKAAVQAYGPAQYNLGVMYANGTGVAKDDAEAVKWYRLAAEQGHVSGQYNLAVRYSDGRGITKDDAEALKWYRKAAEQGHVAAKIKLGSSYESGIGVTKDDAEAVNWYRQAADQGSAIGQYNLGVMYSSGRGVTRNYLEAIKWYRMASDQGSAFGQFGLGTVHENGQGVAKNPVEAATWYRKSAEQGNALAQFQLGSLYADGRGVTKDGAAAVKWYRLAAAQNNVKAQLQLGLIYANGEGAAKDNMEAATWYRKAAEQGDALAQNNLGVLYEQGLGVKRDYTEAATWYRKAADQNQSAGQCNMGFMYLDGRGVPRDDAEAAKWMRKACEQDLQNAQHGMGFMYEHGRGVTKDFAEAVNWYRKAAGQNNAAAQFSLGKMYDDGRGVAKDEVHAVVWFRKAAEQGNAEAQYKMGFMYANGRGVAKDVETAVEWFRKAAAQGNDDARGALARLGLK